MDSGDEDCNSVKFIVPTIVKRTKTGQKTVLDSQLLMDRIEKVYDSKRKYVARLRMDINTLKDDADILGQRGVSRELTRENFWRGNLYQLQETKDRLEHRIKILQDDVAQVVEQFEKKLEELIVHFPETMATYMTQNVEGTQETAELELQSQNEEASHWVKCLENLQTSYGYKADKTLVSKSYLSSLGQFTAVLNKISFQMEKKAVAFNEANETANLENRLKQLENELMNLAD